MEISIFIAKILGPLFFVVGIGLIMNSKWYLKVFEDFTKNAAFLYLGGVSALSLGIVIVVTHNVWMMSWVVIITILGWLSVLKGISLLIMPDWVPNVIEVYKKNPKLLLAHGAFAVGLGAILSVFGYLV